MTSEIAKPPRKQRPKPAQDILNRLGIDAICALIEADESLEKIAKANGMTEICLRRWLSEDMSRSARAEASRKLSSAACDAKALKIILELPAKGTPAQIARAREAAQHYRWRARIRDPQNYGDQQKITHDGSVNLTHKRAPDELSRDELMQIAAKAEEGK